MDLTEGDGWPNRGKDRTMTCPWCQLMLIPDGRDGWKCKTHGCHGYNTRYKNDAEVMSEKLRVHNEAIGRGE